MAFKRKTRRWTVWAALVAVGVNLLILEVLLGRFSPQPVYAIRYSPRGWEHLPSISFQFSSESRESAGFVTYNSDGFRNKTEFQIVPNNKTLRLAILGDSQAEGSMVDDAQSSSAIAEDLINKVLRDRSGRINIRRAEVINAGVYSYEPCQFLRLFQARVKKYKPDIVYVIHYSKFADNVFCENRSGELIFKDFEYSRIQGAIRYLLSHSRAKSHFFNNLYLAYRKHLSSKSTTPDGIKEEMLYYNDVSMSTSYRSKDLRLPLGDYSMEMRSDEGADPSKDSRNLMRLVYERLNEEVSAYGGSLRVLVGHTDPKNRVLTNILRRLGIPYFDLARYLDDARGDKQIGFTLGAHRNNFGNFLVGDVISRLTVELDGAEKL
jgi:hypothetical protein